MPSNQKKVQMLQNTKKKNKLNYFTCLRSSLQHRTKKKCIEYILNSRLYLFPVLFAIPIFIDGIKHQVFI